MSLVSVRGLNVSLTGPHGRSLLSGVDLGIAAGESVALVGESGSGKSLTARAILGLLPPGLTRTGSIRIGDTDIDPGADAMAPLRGGTVALLLQDPFTMLNPLRRVGRQIADSLVAHERATSDTRRMAVTRRLAEVGLLASVADRYPFQLSGGMRQRVGIAAALAGDPALLVADEPTTALDVTTQRDVLALVRRIQHERGMGLLLITHDLRIAFSVCDRAVVMYAGRVMEDGESTVIRARPAHPYTRALLAAEPPLDRRLVTIPTIPGSVPRHDDVAGSCPFADRCALVSDECRRGRPVLAEHDGRRVACIRAAEIGTGQSAPSAVAPVPTPGDPGPALLSVAGLGKTYRGSETPALIGVSLTVAPGESVGIVGESGSGKTTLARCVVGLETPGSGSITFDGSDITDWSSLDATRRRDLRRAVQMVFQDPYSTLNPVRTVGATLREALVAMGQPAGRRDLAQLLTLVGLPEGYATKRPASLSGGERQRVSIARALAGRPQLLVCDESVSALDVSVQAQILDLLTGLQRDLGMALLFITHDLAVVRQVTDKVYVLHHGACVEHGPTGQVLDNPRDDYTRGLLQSVPREDSGWLMP